MAFRMAPEQKRWLDRVVTENGMSKQDFIMARLHDEVERLTKEFVDLRGEVDAATVNTERHDILEMSRRCLAYLTWRRNSASRGDEGSAAASACILQCPKRLCNAS